MLRHFCRQTRSDLDSQYALLTRNCTVAGLSSEICIKFSEQWETELETAFIMFRESQWFPYFWLSSIVPLQFKLVRFRTQSTLYSSSHYQHNIFTRKGFTQIIKTNTRYTTERTTHKCTYVCENTASYHWSVLTHQGASIPPTTKALFPQLHLF